MELFALSRFVGLFLPRRVSDAWGDIPGLAAWLETQSYSVARQSDDLGPYAGRFVETADGFRVAMNGYVRRIGARS